MDLMSFCFILSEIVTEKSTRYCFGLICIINQCPHEPELTTTCQVDKYLKITQSLRIHESALCVERFSSLNTTFDFVSE